ncbi:hypothetical protein Patl1_33767 [Pistacia atlantica]|uniref:Uncharacterized protein n=1 Tax=Pistacia atlantica TaxID=434234 RepID=A0ACC0ZW13_9ROSI|nr:hypothetical protein Patl1_33767 [Pistacia atlantica]
MNIRLLSLLLMLQDMYANVSFYYLKKFCRMITSPRENWEDLLNTKFVSDTGSSLEAFANDKMDASLLVSAGYKMVKIHYKLTNSDQGAIKVCASRCCRDYCFQSWRRTARLYFCNDFCFEEVVHAVEGKIPVLMDGGVRQGTDVFKALALGLKAVLVIFLLKITDDAKILNHRNNPYDS